MRKPFFKFLILVNLTVTATLILVLMNLPDPIPIQFYVDEIRDKQVTIEETTNLYEQKLEEVRQYEVTVEDLKDIGASHEQATAIIQSSQLYHIDPKH